MVQLTSIDIQIKSTVQTLQFITISLTEFRGHKEEEELDTLQTPITLSFRPIELSKQVAQMVQQSIAFHG